MLTVLKYLFKTALNFEYEALIIESEAVLELKTRLI